MTNNKLKNQIFALRNEVFYQLADFFCATTDNSYAYIPTSDNDAWFEDKNNKIHHIKMYGISQENSYADLCFAFSDGEKSKFIKIHHTNTFNRFALNTGLFTFAEKNTDDIYYLIYSDIDKNKFIMISYKALMNLFKNFYSHGYDICDLENLKLMGFNEKEFRIFDFKDYDKLKIDENISLNIEKKLYHCKKTVYNKFYMEKTSLKRTHYGLRKTVLDLEEMIIYQFRDSTSLFNFFKEKNIEISTKNITNKCANQNKILNGEQTKDYSANIINNRYVIIDYTPNSIDVLEKCKKLLILLSEKSKRWAKKLGDILATILDKISKSIMKFKSIFEKAISFLCKKFIDLGYNLEWIKENIKFYNEFKYPKIKALFLTKERNRLSEISSILM